MKFLKTIYQKAYGVYKVIPWIVASLSLVFSLIFGIIDGIDWITVIGEEFEFFAPFIWLIIGSVISFVEFVVFSVIISPTVIRTDAIIELIKKSKDEN